MVTALGKTYHQNCFKCAGCKKPFPTGERVTFTGKNCLCQTCANLQSPDVIDHSSTKTATATTSTAPSAKRANDKATKEGACAGCGEELKENIYFTTYFEICVVTNFSLDNVQCSEFD